MSEEKPTNVIAALAAVMRDIPAIGKDQKSGGGGGPTYNYRGIEQITSAAQTLFGRYGIVFAPHVERLHMRELVVNGKPWTQEELAVTYTVYGPGGVDDKITVGPVIGLGRDNSDKGANKAITQAYKYALLQVLCISDSKEDTDGETYAADAPEPTVDLGAYVNQTLNKDEKLLLRDNWKADFAFPTHSVPKAMEATCRVLINSFVGTAQPPADVAPDDEPEVATVPGEVWAPKPGQEPF